MARFHHFIRRSRLAASPEEVWEHACSPAGINDEFFPWLAMRLPVGELPAAVVNFTVGPCWIWLLGVVPVERDRVFLKRLQPLAFDERSSMLSQRHWLHRRRVRAVPGGVELVDRVAFVPRLSGLGWFYRPLFRAVFAWRHFRLKRRFARR